MFHKYDAPSEPDLLSIDIDGNDLWVWRALTDFNPRVVIVETNQLIPPDEDRTIVYDPDRVWEYESRYFGASVFALYTVARSKGYSMIAVVDQNAIFLRDDDVERLQTDVPHVNDMARLFKPRLPRSYRNPETGEERTFSKLEIEGATLAQRLDMVGDWEPVMERSMRQEDPLDRLWTTSGLTEPE